jgi:hypothetical protein
VAALELGDQEVAVHAGDEVDGDVFRADRLASVRRANRVFKFSSIGLSF